MFHYVKTIAVTMMGAIMFDNKCLVTTEPLVVVAVAVVVEVVVVLVVVWQFLRIL